MVVLSVDDHSSVDTHPPEVPEYAVRSPESKMHNKFFKIEIELA